jgi:enoyl-[acyl-carrier protein] reductase III
MDPTLPLENKVALVTGSGRGIGKAIALQLARQGAHIMVNYVHNQAPALETMEEIRAMGREAYIFRANVGKIEGIDALFDEITTRFGHLNILVNNAAIGFNRPALQQTPNGWDGTMNVNARSILFAAQRAVPLMEKQGGGAIINISSPGSTRVMPDYITVGASKAALEALTRYLGVELAPKKIIVNAVAPGVVETDALKHFAVFQNHDLLSDLASRTPAGRLASPQDVAEVVAFLCSPAAAMICGQTLIVDGGYTLLA